MKGHWLIIAFFFQVYYSFGACKEPFSLKYSEITSRSINISWVDNNNPILGYQLAFGEKGIAMSEATLTTILNQKFRKLDNLKSGTAYIFWLRSVCAPGDTSKWAGPFNFVTAISNSNPCGLNLDIRDNNCDNGLTDFFNIEVMLPPIANPYKLQSVSLIASHTWPADLLIQLESPQGNRIILSDRHGTVDDNYGVPDNDCDQPAVFSDEACLAIAEGAPPFADSYKPDEPLSNLNIQANPSGLWKLIVCDGAANDRGVLKYVYLNFVEEPCNAVESFFVSKITNNAFEISWDKPSNCKNLEIHYQKKGQPSTARTIVVNCNLGKYLITGLEQDVEYEFFLVSSCLSPLISVPSCVRTLSTSCTTINIVEGFEEALLCQQSCDQPCFIEGILFNSEADETDWIVNTGETPTDFTGPASGVLGGGQYVYLESSPSLCQPSMSAILQTRCLKSGLVTTSCDLGFAYHMYGKDIGSLKVELSSDNAASWNSIFSVTGDQGNQWNMALQSLNIAPSTLFSVRFIGQTTSGSEGDLALDLLTLGNVSLADESTYYLDADGDGYGNTSQFIKRCDSSLPLGYSRVGGDCDDKNAEINPGRPDVPCNQTDENCDGILVLTDTSNPMQIQDLYIHDETCNGKLDGSIAIEVSGGTPPIQFDWLHGESGNVIDNLGSGFYKCKITDVNGCGLETQFIEIKSISNFQAIVESVKRPSCNGLSDGEIRINHNGIFTPFSYQWNRGDTTQNLPNVSAGNYYLTITNGIGCVRELGPIEVLSASALQPQITFMKSPLCFGDATGVLEVNVLNGIPPYTYFWKDGFIGNRRAGLTAGMYELTITDGANCRQEFNPVLTGPDQLELDVINLEDVRCFGTKTGQIRVRVTGGTQPYTYAWQDNGPSSQFRPNLSAGSYALTVYDNNGCSSQKSNIILREPPQLFYSIDKITPSGCLQKMDGAISTTIFGGIPPYKYFWTGSSQNKDDISGLLPKNYTLTAVDASNCKITTESITVSSGNIAYPVVIAKLDDNNCPNEKNAAILALCPNARPPLDFNWSNGVQRMIQGTGDTLHQLPGGNYSVTITDTDGCISPSASVQVSQFPPFNYALDVVKNLCNTDSSGVIVLNVNGASPPYDITWSNQLSGKKIEGLKNGSYTAIVNDARSCELTVGPVILTSVSDIATTVEVKDASIGFNNGAIKMIASGGQGNYTITWQPSIVSGFMPQNLSPGLYVYQIEDELGCKVEGSVVVDIISKVQEIDKKVIIRPIPAHDFIELSATSDVHFIEVFSLNGTSLIKEKINAVPHQIDVSHLPSGIYLLKAYGDREIISSRFVKF